MGAGNRSHDRHSGRVAHPLPGPRPRPDRQADAAAMREGIITALRHPPAPLRRTLT